MNAPLCIIFDDDKHRMKMIMPINELYRNGPEYIRNNHSFKNPAHMTIRDKEDDKKIRNN